jgi:hypothetical protein
LEEGPSRSSEGIQVSLFTVCQWIETTSLSTAIREGALYYPILGAFHLAGIGWFGGMVLMGDLSVLGIGLPHAPVAEVVSEFRRWKWVGFAVLLLSGGLLWWSEPVVCYKSASFRISLALLALVGVNAFFFRKGKSRLGACLSLLLWVSLVFAGRGIAFF